MTINATAPPLGRLLDDLTGLSDELGVLSIYVDTDAESGRRSQADIALRNALSELRDGLRREGPRERWIALDRRLDSLDAELAALLDTSRPGRGRALFAALSGGTPRTFASRHHLGTTVAFERTPYLMPLLPALEAEQPFGVISVSGDGVRALDLGEGDAEEAAWLAFDIASDEWRRMVGPAAANPAQARTSASQADLFRRRLEVHRERGVAEAVAPLVGLAQSRDWTRVLLAGEPTRTEPLVRGWPQDAPPLVTTGTLLVATLSPEDVRRTAEPALADARRAEQSGLVKRALDGALSSATGAAAGLADVLSALQEGRVDHLLLDPTARHAGAVALDGRIVPAGEVPAGAGAEKLVEEPHLMERMVQRALATDATVTALDDPARELLSDHDGVAALLRW